jgi:hypothetical protein
MFSVKFPDSLDSSELERTRELLKGMKRKNTGMADSDETFKLIPYASDQKNTDARGGSKGDHDEEDDEDPRTRAGQRVQCA